MPAIVGLAEADALAALTAAEVVAGARSEANDPAPAGIVIGQDPPAGTTVFKDSPVDYVVSLGPSAPSARWRRHAHATPPWPASST